MPPEPWEGRVESVNRERSVQTQRCEQQQQGDLAGSVSVCHHVKEPHWAPPTLQPVPSSSSRLSAVLNASWEFLTTIWLAPLQRTPLPGWKRFSWCVHTSTPRTPPASITMMYEREMKNDDLSQGDRFSIFFRIWSVVADVEPLRYSPVAVFVLNLKLFNKPNSLGCVRCNSDQFVLF